MKRKILGGLAAAAMLAGGLAITQATPVAATQEVCGPLDSGKIDTSGDPASVTVNAPEGKLIDGYCVKAGSDQSTPDGAVKYVDVDPAQKTVVITHYTGKAVSHYSVSYVDAPPPTTPPPVWFPPTYPPFNPEECVEYRLEKATSTWDADTGTWSDWEDWKNAGPLDWGKVPANLTGNHGGTPGEDGHRVFAYVVVDQRAVTTGECAPPEPEEAFVRVTPLCVGPGVYGDLSVPDGEYLMRVRHESGFAPVDYNLQVGANVVSGPWTIGSGETQFRLLPVGTNGVKAVPIGDWVNTYGGTGSTSQKPCDVPLIEVIPTEPGVIPPTCDAPGSVVLSGETVGYDWVLQEDGTYLAVIKDGYVFGPDAVTEFDPGNLDQLTGEQCTPPTTEPPTTEPPTTEPPTTEPPTTEPPTTEPPTTEPPVTIPPVTTQPPPPVTAPPTVPPTVPPQGLPATGSNATNVMVLLGALFAALGGAAIVASRRKPVL